MRKWHRWLSVLFGVFLLWIAVTGVLSHAASLWPTGETAAQELARTTPPPGFACPEGWRCRPPAPQGGLAPYTGFIHHLHSGEEFGPLGTAIAILSGLAMVFFTVSGMWLYVQMWQNRARRQARPRWFWR